MTQPRSLPAPQVPLSPGHLAQVPISAPAHAHEQQRPIAPRLRDGHLQEVPARVLVTELVGEAQNLIRGEVELARAELREVKRLASGAGVSLGIAAVALFFAAGLAAATIVAVLATVMPVWAAALITFALFLVAGVITGVEGLNRIKKMREAPKETVHTLKEDAAWLKQTVQVIKAQRHAHST